MHRDEKIKDALIRKLWIASAKNGRHNGQFQSSKDAIIQSLKQENPESYIEFSRWFWASGDYKNALEKLGRACKMLPQVFNDPTQCSNSKQTYSKGTNDEGKRLLAKVMLSLV